MIEKVCQYNKYGYCKELGANVSYQRNGLSEKPMICIEFVFSDLGFILLRIYWDKSLYIGLLSDYHSKQGKLQHYVELNHYNSVKCLFRRLWMDGMAEF